MLDWHSCQICYPLEIKILLLLLLLPSLTVHLHFNKILISNEEGQFQANHFSCIVVHHTRGVINTFVECYNLKTIDGKTNAHNILILDYFLS